MIAENVNSLLVMASPISYSDNASRLISAYIEATIAGDVRLQRERASRRSDEAMPWTCLTCRARRNLIHDPFLDTEKAMAKREPRQEFLAGFTPR